MSSSAELGDAPLSLGDCIGRTSDYGRCLSGHLAMEVNRIMARFVACLVGWLNYDDSVDNTTKERKASQLKHIYLN